MFAKRRECMLRILELESQAIRWTIQKPPYYAVFARNQRERMRGDIRQDYQHHQRVRSATRM